MKLNHDPHHCHCFKIVSLNSKTISRMKQIGFKKQILEEVRGQIFSVIKRLDEHTQVHFKILQNYTIESEMEYPVEYPREHLNSTYSYSAHKETEAILRYFSIPYRLKRIPPITCIRPKIVKAKNPIHASDIVLGIIEAISIILLSYAALKNKN